MEPSKVVKEYKEELIKSQKQNERLSFHHRGYLFKHLCAVIFDGLLSVVCPWFVIQATSINTQSLTLLINRQKPIKAHKKYSYKLQGLNISHANHVWSTDITYIKIAGGMVYMAAKSHLQVVADGLFSHHKWVFVQTLVCRDF
jgi:hypothetical protein